MLRSMAIVEPGPWRSVPRNWFRGFTVTEILVVIAIIVILIGVLLAVGGVTGGRTAQTRLCLQTLLTIADEYVAQTKGKNVNHAGDTPIDWRIAQGYTNYHWGVSTGKPDDSSERFVVAMMQITECRDAILDLERTKILVDKDDDGFFELRDAWGNMLVYMAGNDVQSVFDPPVEVGLTEAMFPEYRHRFFCSAGEDGQFGTADDLHSFAIE